MSSMSSERWLKPHTRRLDLVWTVTRETMARRYGPLAACLACRSLGSIRSRVSGPGTGRRSGQTNRPKSVHVVGARLARCSSMTLRLEQMECIIDDLLKRLPVVGTGEGSGLREGDSCSLEVPR
jgi:hypothetical protein